MGWLSCEIESCYKLQDKSSKTVRLSVCLCLSVRLFVCLHLSAAPPPLSLSLSLSRSLALSLPLSLALSLYLSFFVCLFSLYIYQFLCTISYLPSNQSAPPPPPPPPEIIRKKIKFLIHLLLFVFLAPQNPTHPSFLSAGRPDHQRFWMVKNKRDSILQRKSHS